MEQTIEFKPFPKRDAEGGGYGRGASSYDAELIEVGPGTPCGEYMRRFWQPVATSASVTSTPQNVRVLGEDLVLFRDGEGRPGLLHSRCAHRGTSLYYGKVENRGIRCCYHGWGFDVQGHCFDQPCEPGGGQHRDKVRQPWYPLEERYGLVFAYLGPADKKPVLPRWDILENPGEDEKIVAIGPSGFGAGADDTVKIIPCSWLQQYENTADPFHLTILHTNFSGVQFSPDFGAMPTVKFEYTDLGVRYVATFVRASSGRVINRISPAVLPNIRSAPNVQLEEGPSNSIVWAVPVDDSHHFVFQALRVPKDFGTVAENHRATRPSRYTDDDADRTPTRPKLWSELSEEHKQKFPGDWEAQISQGPITLHSEEHLATSDLGIVMLRRLLRQQIRLVQEGGDPMNAKFDEDKALVIVFAGNYDDEDKVAA